jgi:hypothetical protein
VAVQRPLQRDAPFNALFLSPSIPPSVRLRIPNARFWDLGGVQFDADSFRPTHGYNTFARPVNITLLYFAWETCFLANRL